MPYIYIVETTCVDSQKSSKPTKPKTTQTYYTTLRSANRAAYNTTVECYKDNIDEYDEESLDDWRAEWRTLRESDKPFIAEGGTDEDDGNFEADWSVVVRKVEAEGPDLEKGERDDVKAEESSDEEEFLERRQQVVERKKRVVAYFADLQKQARGKQEEKAKKSKDGVDDSEKRMPKRKRDA
ncbi:uncharacterized protein STEHIDRAFT_158382 [Stereum hirsutum FP-91666 SS1]|uniref:uncharacterized protein n=1 Tax=Stereum hirsutum (strain FP-91666) TaxID=721885 RepID=UPI0004449BB5|nr:uncharacterized protein STEHIDRAFT_158382 [Stereum hirsutum FP-91666 SS1]EIM84666.1 hypothetical protein STEHIDRAFT_158382 [Stereum hirsutum FP-91666 SS1]